MKTKPKQKTIKAWAVVNEKGILMGNGGACIFKTKSRALLNVAHGLKESVRPVTITIG